MPLSPAELQTVLNSVPASRRGLKTFNMEIPTLIESTGNDALSHAIVGQASNMGGLSNAKQGEAMKKWCDEQLGEGLVNKVTVTSDAAVAELNLTNLKAACEANERSAGGGSGRK